MRILLKLALVLIGLVGLSNGRSPIVYSSFGKAPVAFENINGAKKIQLTNSNFGFCNFGTLEANQVFVVNFDNEFSQLPFNIKDYFNTTVDPMVPLETNSTLTQFDILIQSVIYETVNQAGYMYSGGSKSCAIALAQYMCSTTFLKYDTAGSTSEQPCQQLCTDIETACGDSNTFVFDYVTSFTQVFPTETECNAFGTDSCSSSGNTLDNWENDQTRDAVLFYLYPEDYPTCSYPNNIKEGYRYIYPEDLLPTPFEVSANYSNDLSKFGALVSNLNNLGSTCVGCGNCTASSSTCDYCQKCTTGTIVGKTGDTCSGCSNTVDENGNIIEWHCSTCSGSRGSFRLDQSIKDVLFAGNNENGFEYVQDATEDCVEILLTYLCTYTFRERGYLPCNSICNATRSPIYKCPSSFTYSFYEDSATEIFPDVPECEARGGLDNQGCSAISFLKLGNPFSWKNLYGTNFDFQLRPGGAVKGSVLGFGVLVGLLLVIASLGFIMKQQTKTH